MRPTKIRSLSHKILSQSGSAMMFFAVVLMPIIFFLFTLGLDLSLYFTMSDKLQQAVDEAAMYGYRFLPRRNDTESAVRSYLQNVGVRNQLPMESIRVSVNNDAVEVILDSAAPINFARWFGYTVGLPIQAFASARSAPLDLLIAVDTSAYLAPQPVNDEAWGSEVEWPAATFFSRDFPLYYQDPADETRSIRYDSRLLTQQCFNPLFSMEKLAATALYDYFSAFKLNSLGVGFFPGQTFELDLARMIVPPGQRNDGGEADFDARSGSLFSSNLMCAAAAYREEINTAYKFSPNPEISPIELDPALSANPEYFSQAKVAEVVWSRAVNPYRSADTPAVLRRIRSELLAAPSRQERGGLSADVRKVAFVIMGDLPRNGAQVYPDSTVESALQSELGSFAEVVRDNSLDLTLYFIIFRPSGVFEPAFTSSIEQFNGLLNDFSRIPTQGALKFKLLYGMGPNELLSEVATTLVLDQRSIVLAR